MDEIKVGKRHSDGDQKLIDNIVESAINLGATHPRIAAVVEAASTWDPEKALIGFGTEVKALGDGKVGGYLVRFSTDADPDLTGDYFTADTDFGDHGDTPVLYHHGLDKQIKGRVLGKGTLKKDAIGVWVEAQLAMRDEYEKAVYEMAEAGKLGWSSGTAPHRVERVHEGKAARITSWPLGLDASLTPTPAEPRNAAISLKAYIAELEQAVQPAPDGAQAEAVDAPSTPEPTEITTMSENTAPVVDMAQIMGKLEALEAQMKAAPVVKTSGIADMTEAGKAPAQIAPALDVAEEQLYELKRYLNTELSQDSRNSWKAHTEASRKNAANYAHQKAYDTWVRDPFNTDKHTAMRMAQKATILEGTASLGGNLVPVLYDNRLVGNLKEASILRQAGAFQFPVTGTNSLKVATITRSSSAALVGELAVPTQQEPTFGVVSFDAYAYKALYIASRESLIDSRFDLNAILMENLEWQFIQSENAQLGTGTGSSQPQGLAYGATTGVSAGSILSLLTGDHVIDTFHALPYQYRPNGVWFAHDQVIKAVRKLKDQSGGAASTGNYLWQPGLNGEPDRLMGRPIYPLNTMASSGSASNVLVFADPRFFWISDFAAGATEMQVLQETYAASFAVGYNAWRRFDSNIMVSEAAVGVKLV